MEGNGREEDERRVEGGDGMEDEGRDFGPSQCWKQIDATAVVKRCGRYIVW